MATAENTPYSEDPIDALQRLIKQARATIILLEQHFEPGIGGVDDSVALNACWSVQSQLDSMLETSNRL